MQRRTVQEHVQSVQDYVRAHLSEKITVQEIACALSRNASWVNTFYQSATGECVTALIRRLKTERASQLLRETDCSPAEICAMLGYFDQSHFNRTFKAVTGMTPCAYRNRFQAENYNKSF